MVVARESSKVGGKNGKKLAENFDGMDGTGDPGGYIASQTRAQLIDLLDLLGAQVPKGHLVIPGPVCKAMTSSVPSACAWMRTSCWSDLQ